MKLETRLTFLFGTLTAVFLATLGVLHWAQHRSAAVLHAEIAGDKARQLARIVALTGSTLERFAADYTQWDEMCTFAADRDPEWAKINLEQSLASWRFHGVWVFDAGRSEVYRNFRAPLVAADLAAFPDPALLARLCGPDPLHFFALSPQGLLEVRTAPIHPSDDSRLGEAPQGWFIVARVWDRAQFDQLGALTESTVALAPIPTDGQDGSTISIQIPLPGWDGRALEQLALQHTSPLLANMLSYDTDEALLFLVFGLALLGLASWFVQRWIRQPLRLISTSLATDRPEIVAPLQQSQDEFAHIADLIRSVSVQRLALRREVEDRTYAEQELRRAIVERTALGRDLHDGVIQSIYATGMTLQGVGPLLHSDPAEAQQRLATCVEALNRTIAQLRSYIAGLEADSTPAASLAEGLQKLLQEIRPARPVDYDVQLDPLLAAALPQDSIVQLLFIAREALSNALRHGLARRISVQLGTANDDPAFTIEDDGVGFDAVPTAQRGHGLDNMTRRAEEIGAALTIESLPGRGTRLRVELPWSGLETEHPVPPPPP